MEKMNEELEIVLDTEEMSQFLFQRLIESGFVPTEEEIYVLSHLFFDFLCEKALIVEEE
jgi:hypothetical protein